MKGRTSIVTSDFFVADVMNYSGSACRTHRVPPSFDVGEDVFIIPYAKNTIIVKEDNYFIEFDICGLVDRNVRANGKTGKVINFPHMGEDRVLICKKDYDPYTVVVANNFTVRTARSRERGSYIDLKVKEGVELFVLPYVKDITTIREIDDGNVRIESYSDMMAYKVATKSGRINLDRNWGELDVIIIEL